MTVQRIPGNGRTLMPGLIDNHWHTMLARPTPAQAIEGDLGYTNLLAGVEAQATLMRGFTTVRDLGGPSFGLKRAIDEGLVAGPRIYPSGAMITITGGHGDFRSASELPRRLGGPLSRMEIIGGSMVADSPDEVRVRAREQLLLGASQIKLTAGGGVASPHSPARRRPPSPKTSCGPPCRRPRTGAPTSRVHAYTPVAIQRAIAAGVKVIEHGHLMDEATRRADGREGHLAQLPALHGRRGRRAAVPPANRVRLRRCSPAPSEPSTLAKKYKLKMAFGTDLSVLAGRSGAAGRGAGQDAQVVQRAGATGDGHRHQRRAC